MADDATLKLNTDIFRGYNAENADKNMIFAKITEGQNGKTYLNVQVEIYTESIDASDGNSDNYRNFKHQETLLRTNSYEHDSGMVFIKKGTEDIHNLFIQLQISDKVLGSGGR